MDTLRSDGKAVEVTLVSTKAKGSVVYLEQFFGITMQSGSSGDTVAIEIAQREHEILVPSDVVAAKGDILYVNTSTGVIDDNDAGTVPFLKVTKAKDANDYVWGILLPQLTA
jgi:hypothetical protein